MTTNVSNQGIVKFFVVFATRLSRYNLDKKANLLINLAFRNFHDFIDFDFDMFKLHLISDPYAPRFPHSILHPEPSFTFRLPRSDLAHRISPLVPAKFANNTKLQPISDYR